MSTGGGASKRINWDLLFYNPNTNSFKCDIVQVGIVNTPFMHHHVSQVIIKFRKASTSKCNNLERGLSNCCSISMPFLLQCVVTIEYCAVLSTLLIRNAWGDLNVCDVSNFNSRFVFIIYYYWAPMGFQVTKKRAEDVSTSVLMRLNRFARKMHLRDYSRNSM